MGNPPDFVVHSALVLAAVGAALGFTLAALTPVRPSVLLALGLLVMVPLALVLLDARNGGCAGGECVSTMFILLLIAPPAIIGGGLAFAGLVLVLWRKLKPSP